MNKTWADVAYSALNIFGPMVGFVIGFVLARWNSKHPT